MHLRGPGRGTFFLQDFLGGGGGGLLGRPKPERRERREKRAPPSDHSNLALPGDALVSCSGEI